MKNVIYIIILTIVHYSCKETTANNHLLQSNECPCILEENKGNIITFLGGYIFKICKKTLEITHFPANLAPSFYQNLCGSTAYRIIKHRRVS